MIALYFQFESNKTNFKPEIIAGMLMISPIKNLNFDDLTEVISVFAMITLMIFSFNLGIGLTAGFVTYIIIKNFYQKIYRYKHWNVDIRRIPFYSSLFCIRIDFIFFQLLLNYLFPGLKYGTISFKK